MSRRVMVIAGEASGDRHAAGLVEQAQSMATDVVFDGVGGEHLEAAGVTLYHRASDLGVVGVSEVLAKLGTIRAALKDLKRRLRENPPDVLLLVDFPDFNLMLAKVAKEMNVPVVYFISPQLWAWRKGRIKTIKQRVHRMIVLFPFEKSFYDEHGVQTVFAGHPLAEFQPQEKARRDARRSLGLGESLPVFGLLPGSRGGEISLHLEPMFNTAQKILETLPGAVFLVPVANTVSGGLIEEKAAESGLPVIALRRSFGTIVDACDAALVASGTATLEVALRLVPLVVVYKLSLLTWLVGKVALRIKNVSLVNLVAGRRVVPELLQGDFTPERAAQQLLEMAAPGPRREEVLAGLAEVRDNLGSGGAYQRAAEALVEVLDQTTRGADNR